MQIDRPIAIALILFIILLLMFFLVMPEYKIFRTLQQQLGEKTAEFNAEHDYYNSIDTTFFKLKSYQDNIQKIDDALPSESSLGRLVYFIQKSGADSGLIINNVFLNKSSLTAGGNSDVKNVGFSVNLLGSYSSLENFIITLEQSSRLFEINSISFNSGSTSSPSETTSKNQSQFQVQQTYSFNLEITTHSY